MNHNLPHARPRWQVRLELLLKALVIAVLIGFIFVAMTNVDPELTSRRLG